MERASDLENNTSRKEETLTPGEVIIDHHLDYY